VPTSDKYLAIQNLSLLQRQAGVEPAVAELVTAYGRLLVDNGQPIVFDPRPFPPLSDEEKRFADLQQKNPAVDARFLAFLAAYCARMSRRGYIPIVSREDLAERLGWDEGGLLSIVSRSARLYREIRLPRKNGTFRQIHSPREPIRGIQRWILQNILNAYRPHAAAHGFVRGRSIVSNAAQHVGNSVLIAIDIADFFPSVTFKRVRKGFERLGYPYSVALLLANLCTREGVLPQGAPTSPALSNLVCENLDRRLAGLAASRGFSYSRYADDMAFSSNDRCLDSLLPFIREIVEQEGFRVHDRKTRIARGGARRIITGIVVNEHPNLPRAHVRKLRAASHRLATHGPSALKLEAASPGRPSDPERVLDGHLGFLAMVNPRRRLALGRLRKSRTAGTSSAT